MSRKSKFIGQFSLLAVKMVIITTVLFSDAGGRGRPRQPTLSNHLR